MKKEIERRKPQGPLDYLALSVTTFGIGYLPVAPGTFGSLFGVLLYLYIGWGERNISLGEWTELQFMAWLHAANAIVFLLFCLLGIWAANRSTALFGNADPSQAVVDEVIGQLIVFLFVPFGIGWPFIIAGFILFRLFDIWKPYPIDDLQSLPGGLGVCADDILAGVYAGVCLSVVYAISISL